MRPELNIIDNQSSYVRQATVSMVILLGVIDQSLVSYCISVFCFFFLWIFAQLETNLVKLVVNNQLFCPKFSAEVCQSFRRQLQHSDDKKNLNSTLVCVCVVQSIPLFSVWCRVTFLCVYLFISTDTLNNAQFMLIWYFVSLASRTMSFALF